MNFVIWTFWSVRKNWETIWTVASPVGRLGALFNSNWGISFSFIMKEHGMSSSPSSPLAVSLSARSHSLSIPPPLLPLRSCIFTGFLLGFLHHLDSLMSAVSVLCPVLTDLSVGEWQQDGSSGNTSRVLSYTIALNNPLGPKTAPVVETQVSLRHLSHFCLHVILTICEL